MISAGGFTSTFTCGLGEPGNRLSLLYNALNPLREEGPTTFHNEIRSYVEILGKG